MRRTTILVVVISLLLLGAALPAVAGGTANCGSGGHGYTSGTPGILRHKFGNSDVWSSGTVYHGYFTGSQGWEVYGATTENGWCVT